jgi:ABC-type branched-subunit amino acid transport system substrate-binding protein
MTWLEGLNAPSNPALARRVACALALVAALLGGCDRALGIHEFSLQAQADQPLTGALACTTHSECSQLPADGGTMFQNDFCHAGRCVSLRSEDCETITGPAADSRAVLIGSLFATSGAQRQTNLARQRSAVLAVEQINAAGGVRTSLVGFARPLALVSCDTVGNLTRASRHLIDDLGVSAIVGPNTSQDTLDLARQISIESGTLLVSPTAQAASIADLLDHDLSWLMVPNDAQRMPLMAARINALEAQLKLERPGRPLRLGIVLRDDVLSQGARAGLSSLLWNGEPVTGAGALGESLRVDSYAPSGEGLAALVEEYVVFAPDVVVMVGTAETVSLIMGPLERDWLARVRPHYVVTDSSKVPELIELVRGKEDLRARVTGIGVLPTDEASPNLAAFASAYEQRFGADHGSVFGTGQAYDAVYALTLAYAGARQTAPARGEDLARGLRSLYGGAETLALRPANLSTAQDALLSGQAIRALGSFSPLRWDERGAVLEGTVEVFCLAAVGGEASFASSGLSYDLASGRARGMFSPCPSDAASVVQTAASAEPSTCTPPCMPNPDAADAGVPSAPTPREMPVAPTEDAGSFARYLSCGGEACGASAREYCCISAATGVASCEVEPQPCIYEFRCVRSSDCRADEQCCEVAGKASCIPASAACSGAQFECTSLRDCLTGQQCCSHLNADNTGYSSTRCEDACDTANSSSPMCEVALDCPTGSVCRVSNYLPNLHVCEALIR